jgi:hypothetical protein
MFNLKKVLYEAYDGFADKRIKKLEKGFKFIVDDRDQSDFGADKQLFPYFCMIFADVSAPDQVKVSLLGNVPDGRSVQDWLARHPSATVHASPIGQKHFEIVVTPPTLATLLDLAQALRAITAPGRRYSVITYKYVCPRTARSLERLVAVLRRTWSSSASPIKPLQRS